MLEEYKKAIDVLKIANGRHKDLIWEIAKSNPIALIEAAKKLNLIENHSLEEKIKKMILSSPDKISAIKEYRAMTGEGLKESKEAVEKIKPNWN
jgi:ribosomal protein L7/L12